VAPKGAGVLEVDNTTSPCCISCFDGQPGNGRQPDVDSRLEQDDLIDEPLLQDDRGTRVSRIHTPFACITRRVAQGVPANFWQHFLAGSCFLTMTNEMAACIRQPTSYYYVGKILLGRISALGAT